MKKIICIIAFFSTLFLISCNVIITQNETTFVVATSVATTKVVYTSIKDSDSSTIASPIETVFFTNSSTDTSEKHIITPVGDNSFVTEAKLKGFYKYAKEFYFSKEKPYEHRHQRVNGNGLEDVKCHYAYCADFFEMTVAGYTGETYVTQTTVFTECYVYLKDLASGGYLPDVYIKKMIGLPGEPCYGEYFPKIGDKFLAFRQKIFRESDVMRIYASVYKIEEIDGVKWVYPDIYTDFSSMKCAVKITDEAERLFYKEGKDDDILAYMEKNNIPNPTVDYKCEFNAFIEEIGRSTVVDTENFTPVGEYTSILDAFRFEGFAEFPEDLRLDDEHPYLPKSKIDVTAYQPTVENNKDIIVTIIGYKGDETYENGMYYSTYYVYAEPWAALSQKTCYDDTVYEMRVFGTPSHPYYGQHRIEIGDRFLRLETDNSFVQTDSVLPATSLFYLSEGEKLLGKYVFEDFNTDFSNIYVNTNEKENFVSENEKYVYIEGRDDDVIAYMKENDIEPPIYEKKAQYYMFSTSRRLGLE